MRINEFEFTPDNHFVAVEYYWLIFNRTFLILVTEKELIGIKVHGLIGVETGSPIESFASMAIDGDLNNAYSYIKGKYLERIKDIDLGSNDFLKANNSNFIIQRSDIVETTYDKRKKWGMGYYPHDGKVYVKTRDHQTREFIIMGSQSGLDIKDSLTRRN